MPCFTSAVRRSSTQPPLAVFSHLVMTHRYDSSIASDNGSGRSAIDVDAIARPMGYGPFSATTKARVLRDKAEADHGNRKSTSSHPACAMQNMTLQTNLHLRLSLAGVPHPSQLQGWAYTSPEWRLAFVRLYRAILRLHNKTMAVSLRTARSDGSEAAVSAVTGVRKAGDGTALPAGAHDSSADVVEEEKEDDDCLLRYLLTPEQQEFGNRFVQGEFQRHVDADAVSAAIFYTSWYDYVLQLASGVTSREMTEKEKRLLSDEQKEKLNTLRGAFVDLRVSKNPQYMP